MPHSFSSVIAKLCQALCLLAVILVVAPLANAQSLGFTPGIAGTYAGDTTGKLAPSSATYTGPLSGLVFGIEPAGMAFDANGNLYVADYGGDVIRVIASGKGPIPAVPAAGSNPAAGAVYPVAGNGTITFGNPGSLTPPCSFPGTAADAFGNGCPATQVNVAAYGPLAVDAQGNVYLADPVNYEVRVIYGGGTVPGLHGTLVPGNIYAVAGTGTSGSAGDGGVALNAQFGSVYAGLALDSHGNIYVSDPRNGAIRLIYAGGSFPGLPATPVVGNIYTVAGTFTTPCAWVNSSTPCGDNGPATAAQFTIGLLGLAIDGSGNLYASDGNLDRVRAIYVGGNLPGISNPTIGDIYKVVGGLGLSSGTGRLRLDPGGDLYIAGGLVYRLDSSGIITVVFGGAPYSSATGVTSVCPQATNKFGDGCPANQAALSPYDVVVAPGGDLYISDHGLGGSLIRKLSVSTTTLFFSGTFGFTIPPQVVNVYNPSSQPLVFSAIALTGPFAQAPSGGSTDCTSSTTLQPGASCQLGIIATNTQAGQFTGALGITSNATNATSGQNIITLNTTVTKAASSAVLSASPAVPAQAGPGQPITFTVNVFPQSGVAAIPSGTVTFNSGSTVLGTATLNGSGTASFTTTTLAAGSYGVTASYPGDSDFTTSTSGYVFVRVASSSIPVPVVSLAASASSATAGQSITFTATVAPPSGTTVPTGNVVFTNGVHPISASVPLNSSGVASFSTASLPIGLNTIIAAYSGDTNFSQNASNAVALTVTSNAQLTFSPGIISSLAGNYSGGYGGDGGPANGPSVQVNSPYGVASDSAGNVYIADTNNNIIRVVASGQGSIPGITNPLKGNIYTVAGTPLKTCTTTSCGDGGAATSALLNGPVDVYADGYGNVYIADQLDQVVRKVDASGKITTVAGTLQASGYSGDGGPATMAKLSGPIGVVADNAGNIFIVDGYGSFVRKVDAQTGIISTIAGSQAAAGTFAGDGGPANAAGLNGFNGLSLGEHISLDSSGNLYIADSGNSVVRKVNAQTGIIATVAGHFYDTTVARCGTASCFGGDGGPATAAQLYSPTAAIVDAAGNLYVSDTVNFVLREVSAQTGIINTIAGSGNNYCQAAPCGDGGLATNATFGGATGIAFDPQGNLYIADTVVRQITGPTTTVNFGSSTLGATPAQTITVTNTGSQSLTISGITVPAGFTQVASTGTDCTPSTTLTPAAQCLINVQFFPTAANPYNAQLLVTSNSANATNGQNIITLSGTGVANSGTQPQTITFPTPAGPYYTGAQIPLGGTADSGLALQYLVNGPGLILNNGAANASLKITGVGAIKITAYQFGNTTFAAATPVTQTVTSVQAVLTITAKNQSITAGQTVPTYNSPANYTITGFVSGDSLATLSGQPVLTVVDSTGTTVPVGSTPAIGNYTLVITQGTLVVPSYYQLNFQNGIFLVTGARAQSIVFPAPPASVTYGAPPITLAAVANDATTGQPDGLQVSYSVAGPGSVAGTLLSITGAGSVAVTANQPGSSVYAAAPPVTQSILVAKASLSVTAMNQTLAQGVGLPSLVSAGAYAFGSFQNQETPAVLTGAPVLTIVDGHGNVLVPGSTPPVGTYTIQISQGSLSSPNYAFSFVNGTLTIVSGQSQTVSFPALTNVTYGAAPITLGASASSGLGVIYSVTSGPATVAGNLLAINGAGVVAIVAAQPGNSTYSPASASQTLTVGPAVLTVQAQDATRVNNVPNPSFTYTISGFVNGDTRAVVGGLPSLTTPATPGSPVGTYPIVAAQQPPHSASSPLTAANYTFAFVNATLTITSGGPSPDYSLSASPAVLGIPQGQFRQTTITLLPNNYYQGVVNLSCGTLPANVTCVFSPAALNPDGNGNAVTGTLTVNSNGSSTIIGQSRPARMNTLLAGLFYAPGGFIGILLVFSRKHPLTRERAWRVVVFFALVGVATIAMAACGSAGNNPTSPNAKPGTSTVVVTAAGSGSVSHSLSLTITIE